MKRASRQINISADSSGTTRETRPTLAARQLLAAAVMGIAMGTLPAAAQTLGPALPGRIAIAADVFDHVPEGYVLEEHFLSGTAKSYQADGPGPHASITVAGSAPFTTLVVVVRPKDPIRFNGSVIVEASDTSGTLHQAAECIRLGRWLFIMRSVVDNPNLTWPTRFLSNPKTVVLNKVEDILSRM